MTILVYLCVFICIAGGIAELAVRIYNELHGGYIKEVHYTSDRDDCIDAVLYSLLISYPNAVIYLHSDASPPYPAQRIAQKYQRIELCY